MLVSSYTGRSSRRADAVGSEKRACQSPPASAGVDGQEDPQDGLQAKFSVYHGGAVGLVFGKAGPAEYEDHVVTSQEVTSVRDKIAATADENLGADEAELVLEFEDGQTLRHHVLHAVGSLEVPMTDAQLQNKFVDQVALVLEWPVQGRRVVLLRI